MNANERVFHPMDDNCTVHAKFDPESKLVTLSFSRTVDALTMTRAQAGELAHSLLSLAKGDKYQKRREENEAVLKRMKL